MCMRGRCTKQLRNTEVGDISLLWLGILLRSLRFPNRPADICHVATKQLKALSVVLSVIVTHRRWQKFSSAVTQDTKLDSALCQSETWLLALMSFWSGQDFTCFLLSSPHTKLLTHHLNHCFERGTHFETSHEKLVQSVMLGLKKLPEMYSKEHCHAEHV